MQCTNAQTGPRGFKWVDYGSSTTTTTLTLEYMAVTLPWSLHSIFPPVPTPLTLWGAVYINVQCLKQNHAILLHELRAHSFNQLAFKIIFDAGWVGIHSGLHLESGSRDGCGVMFTESQEGRKSAAIVIDSQCLHSDQNLSCQQIICKHKQLQSQFENGVHRTTVQIVRLPSVLFSIYLVATLNRKMHQSQKGRHWLHVKFCLKPSEQFSQPLQCLNCHRLALNDARLCSTTM